MREAAGGDGEAVAAARCGSVCTLGPGYDALATAKLALRPDAPRSVTSASAHTPASSPKKTETRNGRRVSTVVRPGPYSAAESSCATSEPPRPLPSPLASVA